MVHLIHQYNMDCFRPFFACLSVVLVSGVASCMPWECTTPCYKEEKNVKSLARETITERNGRTSVVCMYGSYMSLQMLPTLELTPANLTDVPPILDASLSI